MTGAVVVGNWRKWLVNGDFATFHRKKINLTLSNDKFKHSIPQFNIKVTEKDGMCEA